MEYCLTTEALCKQYRHTKALDGLSMHVPKGAIYGFVGKNGAGKTTLIRIICGLQKPTSGEYTLYEVAGGDKDIVKTRRRMGAIVETPSIYMDMTAADNIRMQYRILGRPTDAGIGELLSLVGLSDTGRKKAGKFSLGMRQRLGIAVALAGEPDFLVLDEPINGLDPQGIIEIRELIVRLNRERQITFLISSHLLEELSKLATHYGFIDHGRLVREISAAQLEEACRKCVRVEVTDEVALTRVLDKKQVAYRLLGGRTAEIYTDLGVTDLVLALDKEHCKVLSYKEQDESLESYYVNLVGGEIYE